MGGKIEAEAATETIETDRLRERVRKIRQGWRERGREARGR